MLLQALEFGKTTMQSRDLEDLGIGDFSKFVHVIKV